MIQAEQAARDGEAAYYESKITQLEERYCLSQQNEELHTQLKAELMHSKKQIFEAKISYEKRIGQLEVELKQKNFVPSSSIIQKTELPSYGSDVLKSTRSSSHTYISMKDSDSPHYESIHSSMIQVNNRSILLMCFKNISNNIPCLTITFALNTIITVLLGYLTCDSASSRNQGARPPFLRERRFFRQLLFKKEINRYVSIVY